ncbi:hypothetical protein, partial [Vibrio vulnificus]|uniref:hypothetical protein n=1 Tax=Vibrio vulnificus TaxID=672 RepID=UPI000AF52F6D
FLLECDSKLTHYHPNWLNFNSDNYPARGGFGVIAGFDSINVLTNLKSEDNRNFIQKFFEGTLLMNISRLFFFGITFLFGLIMLIMATEKISDLRYSRNFKKSIEQFKKCNSQRIANVPNKFFDILQGKRKSTLESIFKDLLKSEGHNFLFSKDLNDLGVLNITEIGREIVDDNALSILIEFLHLLAEDGLIEKPEIQEKNPLSVAV